jgi:hypothetical protein
MNMVFRGSSQINPGTSTKIRGSRLLQDRDVRWSQKAAASMADAYHISAFSHCSRLPIGSEHMPSLSAALPLTG